MPDQDKRRRGRFLATVAATLTVIGTALSLDRGRSPQGAAPRPIATPTERDLLLAQGWGVPAPRQLIKPSYWPFVFGLGITFLLGGIATIYLVSGVGLVIFAVGFIGWLNDLLDEQDNGATEEGERSR